MSSSVVQQYFLLQIKLSTGTVLHLTSADVDIIHNGVTYGSDSGLVVKKLQRSLALESVDCMDLELFIQEGLTPESLRTAEFALYLYEPTVCRLIFQGHLATVELVAAKYKICVQGLERQLSCLIGDVFSKNCRTCLGSRLCGINPEDYSYSTQVLDYQDDTHEVWVENIAIGMLEKDYFKYGKLHFTTGALRGQSFDISSSALSRLKLESLPNGAEIMVGDGCVLYAGCNRSLECCRDRFHNTVNFRGEPYIPDSKLLLQVK